VNPQTLQLLKVFGAGLLKSGILKPAGAAAREVGEGAVKAATKAPTYTQRSLIPALQSAQPGRSVYGPKISPEDVDFRAMLRPSPRASEVPSLPPRPNPNQLDLFRSGPAPVPAFKTVQQQGPISQTAVELYDKDPGTYRSIQDLARRATAYYGKPVGVDDLVGPGGTDLLRNLEQNFRGGPAITRSSGGNFPPSPPRPPSPRGGESAPSSANLAVRQYVDEFIGAPGGRQDIIDVDVRELQNAAGGLRQMDLSRALGLAAGGAGLAGLGYAAGRYGQGGGQEQPVQTPMGPTTASPEIGVPNDPGAQAQTARAAAAASMSAGAGVSLDAPVYRGAEGQTVITTKGDNEELRSLKQQYASKPSTPARGLEDYYRQREAYASFPKNRQEIVGELSRRGILDTPELTQWAAANPTLAYELLRKATGSNTLPSQQTPQIKQYEFGTALGTNNINNAFGNSEAAAQSLLGTQGAADLAAATYPQVYERIEGFPASSVRGYYIK
jgi:hypothetical protein